MGEKGGKEGNRTRHITKRVVDTLQPGGLVWDSDVSGFGVRRQRAAKVYVLKTRVGGRQRWFTIGRHGSPWTPERARNEARRLLGEIADRKDPAAIRESDKRNPTVADLAVMFLREHVATKRKATTAANYRDQLDRLILPKLGHCRVVDVSRSDIARLHHSLKDTPYQGNRVLALLSVLFSWAERNGYRPDGTNPCRHVEKYPERSRERFLSTDELARLGNALREAERDGEPPSAVAALRLLALTGARKNEILTLKWNNVDFENNCLRLPETKTGAKVIPLGAPAVQLLSSLPCLEGNPHVIPGERTGHHFVGLQKVWARIRARAGLDDLRIHDLRHAFASVGAAAGDSLLVIGALLGHHDQATTQRYAHLSNDPLHAAADRIAGHIASVMKGGAGSAEIVDLKRNP
jgi:integrase